MKLKRTLQAITQKATSNLLSSIVDNKDEMYEGCGRKTLLADES